MRNWLLTLQVVLLFLVNTFAQTDTLQLTLKQAETNFIQSNLQLIATRLGISEYKAYELQAGLRVNPNLYIEHMPYNTQARKIGGLNQSNAEQIVQFQYLIQVAQKRQKAVSLAQATTQQAENSFKDFVRTLNFQLRTTFYDLYYTQRSIQVYDQEINTLRQTLNAYQVQFEKGNVPLKDIARLKSYLLNLTSERQDFVVNQLDNQRDLAFLTGESRQVYIQPVVDQVDISDGVSTLNYQDLLTASLENRYDLKILQGQQEIEQRNLSLQQANRRPDLTIQGIYDRNAGYVPHYFGVGVSANLPVFNRNQGNIQAAKVRIQEADAYTRNFELLLEKEVMNALNKVNQANEVAKTVDSKFNADFENLIRGVVENYKKQNISVVEFIDFFDSYKQSSIQNIKIINQRRNARVNLNYVVGKDILP
jgi:cobalt-zinc-cadmium efflux system outer membrane protein